MTVKEFLSMISPHSKEGYIAIDNGIKNNDIYYDIKEKKFFKTLTIYLLIFVVNFAISLLSAVIPYVPLTLE